MIKTFSITNENLDTNCRLEPSFHYYGTVLKQKLISKGINFIKLDELSEKISDGEHSHIPRINRPGIRYLYGRNIKEGLINFDPITDDSYISDKNYDSFKRTHIRDGDVLLTIVGTVGKSAVYRKHYVGIAGIPRHIANIRLKRDTYITPEFLSVFFRSRPGKWQIQNITTGNIQPLLSIKNIRTLDIPLPEKAIVKTITEQELKAIEYESEALSKIEKARNLFLNKINLDLSNVSKNLSFSINLDFFKSADLWIPKYSAPRYLEILEMIKKNWKIEKLGKLVTFKKGDEVGSINYKKYTEKRDDDIPFIRTSDFVNFEVDNYPDYYVEKEISNYLDQELSKGDLLFTKDGKIGSTAFITEFDRVIISSGVLRIRVSNAAKKLNITPEYLFMVLSTEYTGLYPAIRRTVVASTIPHLREDRLKDIEIPIIDEPSINTITKLVSEAFILKNNKKILMAKSTGQIEGIFQ